MNACYCKHLCNCVSNFICKSMLGVAVLRHYTLLHRATCNRDKDFVEMLVNVSWYNVMLLVKEHVVFAFFFSNKEHVLNLFTNNLFLFLKELNIRNQLLSVLRHFLYGFFFI